MTDVSPFRATQRERFVSDSEPDSCAREPDATEAGGGTGKRVIDQFSAYQRGRGFSEATVKRRRLTLRALACHWAPKAWSELTTVEIEEWLGTYGAPRTRAAYRSDVRMFYEWATDRDLLEANPAAKV